MGGIPGTRGPYPGAALFKGELARPPLGGKGSQDHHPGVRRRPVTVIITNAFLIITNNHLVGETRPREDKMPRPEGEIIPRGRDMPVRNRDQNND